MKRPTRQSRPRLRWPFFLLMALQPRLASASVFGEENFLLFRIKWTLSAVERKVSKIKRAVADNLARTIRLAQTVDETNLPQSDWDARIQAPGGLFTGLGEDGAFVAVSGQASRNSAAATSDARRRSLISAFNGLTSELQDSGTASFGRASHFYATDPVPPGDKVRGRAAGFDGSYDAVLQRLARQAAYARLNGDALVRNLSGRGLSAFQLSAYQARSVALTAAASLQTAAQVHQSAMVRAQERARTFTNAEAEAQAYGREVAGQRWPLAPRDVGARRGRLPWISTAKGAMYGGR